MTDSDDLRDQMEETKRRAEAMGIQTDTESSASSDTDAGSGAPSGEAEQDDSPDSTTSASATDSEDSSSESGSGDEPGPRVADRDHVNMLLTPSEKQTLNNLYKAADLAAELNTDGSGGGIEKNRDFYPAVIQVVLNNRDDLCEELGIPPGSLDAV